MIIDYWFLLLFLNADCSCLTFVSVSLSEAILKDEIIGSFEFRCVYLTGWLFHISCYQFVVRAVAASAVIWHKQLHLWWVSIAGDGVPIEVGF